MAAEETATVAELSAGPETAVAIEPAPARVEDVNNLSNALSVAELAKLDETDPIAAATIRSQMNWAKEGPSYFAEEDAATKKRQALLDELSARDAEEARKRRIEEEAKAKADELARVDELIAAQQKIIDDAKAASDAARDEIKRLIAVKKAG